MAIRGLELVPIQEYSPEQAGEMVGWFDIKRLEDREVPLTIVNVTYGAVGENGARYHKLQDEKGDLFDDGNVKGFEGSVDLRVVADDSRVHDFIASRSSNPDFIQNFREDGRIGASLISDEGIYPGRGQWALGASEILHALKRELATVDKDWLYRTIYYNLAIMTRRENVLADSEMRETTAEELDGATEYQQTLVEISGLDVKMLKGLTVFGGIEPQKIPEVFTESRREVADRETRLAKAQANLALGRWQRPLRQLRTWPYMDPLERDEAKSFGQELDALKRSDIGPAQYELTKELQAIERRQEMAGIIAARLVFLRELESVQAITE